MAQALEPSKTLWDGTGLRTKIEGVFSWFHLEEELESFGEIVASVHPGMTAVGGQALMDDLLFRQESIELLSWLEEEVFATDSEPKQVQLFVCLIRLLDETPKPTFDHFGGQVRAVGTDPSESVKI